MTGPDGSRHYLLRSRPDLLPVKDGKKAKIKLSKELRRETKSWTERLEISYLELLVETLPVLLDRPPGSDKSFISAKLKLGQT